MNILTINLVVSTFVFWVAARMYVVPKLPFLQPRVVLLPQAPSTTECRHSSPTLPLTVICSRQRSR